MQGNETSIDVKGMKAELYNAALCGSFEEVSRVSNWKESETITKNNILHVHVGKPLHKKAKKGLVCMKFLEKVLNDEDGSVAGYSLLWKVNSNGDTPLHLAARFGHDDAVHAFLERAKEVDQVEVTRMLIMINKNKDTALHEAARVGHAAVLKLLVDADFDCPYEQNEEGETPLYLAAERGSTSSVLAMLETNPSALVTICKGPCGQTALHAAVQWGTPDMVLGLLEKDRSLLKIQNEEGLTPFHSAAGEINKPKHLKILLKYDRNEMGSSALYIRDIKGRSALHIAMLRCNWKAIEDLIATCPDIVEIVDKKGQNVLHYAAKWTCLHKIIKLLRMGHLDKLINDKDVDGNTPLHLLADFDPILPHKRVHLCIAHLPSLVKMYPFMDLKAYNKKNYTVGDILASYDSFLRQEQISMGVTPRGRRMNTYESDIIVEEATFVNNTFGEWNLESLKETAHSRLVVATLIATVSFTAGFTLPGGFDQNQGKDIGLAVLKDKISFKLFLISDAVAFTTSTIAILIYFVLVAQDAKWAIQSLSFWGLLMNTISLGALMIAFLTGVSTVLSKSHTLVIAICVLSMPFFYCYYRLIRRTIHSALRWSKTESARKPRVHY